MRWTVLSKESNRVWVAGHESESQNQHVERKSLNPESASCWTPLSARPGRGELRLNRQETDLWLPGAGYADKD